MGQRSPTESPIMDLPADVVLGNGKPIIERIESLSKHQVPGNNPETEMEINQRNVIFVCARRKNFQSKIAQKKCLSPL